MYNGDKTNPNFINAMKESVINNPGVKIPLDCEKCFG